MARRNAFVYVFPTTVLLLLGTTRTSRGRRLCRILLILFTFSRLDSLSLSLSLSSCSGNWDLLDDEVEGSYISAWITKTHGKSGVGSTVWHSEEEDHEEDFSFTVDAVGKYELCFELETDPENDDYAESYTVGFNLRLDPAVARAMDEGQAGPDTQQAMQIIESAHVVETNWYNLVDHYVYLRNRENLAVQMSEKIQDRVMGWTILEAIVVVTMAVGQVLYWKKFFETRGYL